MSIRHLNPLNIIKRTYIRSLTITYRINTHFIFISTIRYKLTLKILKSFLLKTSLTFNLRKIILINILSLKIFHIMSLIIFKTLSRFRRTNKIHFTLIILHLIRIFHRIPSLIINITRQRHNANLLKSLQRLIILT